MNEYLIKTLIFFLIAIQSCHNTNSTHDLDTGYAFKSPDMSVILPDVLHEISGLTLINDSSFACIQDEIGIVFFYDLNTKSITRELTFAAKGDFEGIARADSDIYVLRSDGTIFEIQDFESDRFLVTKYQTKVPSKDNEGLCYDPDRGMLLLACKDNVSKKAGSKDDRYVYGFDTESHKLTKHPVYTFSIKELEEFAVKNKVKVPHKSSKKSTQTKPEIKFRPSGVGIQPGTQDIYILSSDDHLLFVFSYAGAIKSIVRLDPDLFLQPEGITFYPDGDLLISNEGGHKKPTILKFDFHDHL
jgi:uncharacterized protein YjiK